MTTARIHLHLRTADLSAATTFYTALLGPPDKTLDDLVRFQPESVPLSLTLMPGTPPPLHGAEHQGLKFARLQDASAAWARIAAAGLQPAHSEEAVACCGAVQDKQWFSDPDGRPWEVYTVLHDQPMVVIDAPKTACCT